MPQCSEAVTITSTGLVCESIEEGQPVQLPSHHHASEGKGENHMTPITSYTAKSFNLHGLQGISDRTLEMHFKLYEGYVSSTNTLNEHIRDFLKDGQIDQEEMPAYSELTRRLGFEYNGMVLHEDYFENLTREVSEKPKGNSGFRQAAEDSFGSYELWKTDFIGVGKMRGVGWAICYLNPSNGRLSNNWVTLHESGNIAGFVPVLVMDVWEHAFILDYQPSQRASYIQAFFSNINWSVIEERLHIRAPRYAGAS
jgi:Fe-Mn family superoxide dismutase